MTDGAECSRRVIPSQSVQKGVVGHRRWQQANRPTPPFIWMELEMVESQAWAAMSLAARRVVDRIAIEHMKHGGTRNGMLTVTFDDFEAFGIRRKSIAPAIRIAVTLGVLDITHRGRRAYGVAGSASTYGLTWLPRCDATPASNRWQRIATMAEAKARISAC
jgi:hypothetical protein